MGRTPGGSAKEARDGPGFGRPWSSSAHASCRWEVRSMMAWRARAWVSIHSGAPQGNQRSGRLAPLAARDRSGAPWFCGYGATGTVPALQGLRRGVARTLIHSRNPQGKESPNSATSASHFARYCPGRSDLNHDLLPPDGGHGRYEGGTGVTEKPGHRAGLRAFHAGRTAQTNYASPAGGAGTGDAPTHSLLASQLTPAVHLGTPGYPIRPATQS